VNAKRRLSHIASVPRFLRLSLALMIFRTAKLAPVGQSRNSFRDISVVLDCHGICGHESGAFGTVHGVMMSPIDDKKGADPKTGPWL